MPSALDKWIVDVREDGTYPLSSPANPAYMRHICFAYCLEKMIEGQTEFTENELMNLVMKDYKGGCNPAVVQQVVQAVLKDLDSEVDIHSQPE